MGIFDFLKGSKAENRFAIALDIGTEFVKALIFEVLPDKGNVLGVGIKRQKLTDMQGGMVTDIQGVIRNCQEALALAAKEAKIVPSQVIVGIAGELVKGTSTTIRYQRPDSKTQITLKELKDIISKVQRRAFDRARTVLSYETGHEEIDVRLVNAAVTDVRIDGYKVTNPLGFQGKSVQVSVFNAFAPIVHLGALQTIAQSLDLDLISITAEPYAVARCLGPGEDIDFSAIFIDVGGGTTDIAVVRSGGVEGTKMLALGGRAFTKRIAREFDLPFSQAEELKIAYSTKRLRKKETILKIKEAIASDCQTWLSGLELTLGEFSHLDLLPSKILMCGGGSVLPDLAEIIERASWPKNLPFSRKPTVHFLKPSDVVNLADNTGKLRQPKDVTPMALANLALPLVGQESVVEGILGSIVDSLRV